MTWDDFVFDSPHSQVLDEYEGLELLFIAPTKTGDRYIFYWFDCDDEWTLDKYLVTKVSSVREKEIRFNEIDLRDIFFKAEDGQVLEAVWDTKKKKEPFTSIPISSLPSEKMANPGVKPLHNAPTTGS